MPIDGNDILYHYLHKQLRENDIWLFQMLVARLVTSLAIWFPPSLYAHVPILLPHVIRDASCRPRREGAPDEWGAPDQQGYCRDDNSLVKNLPKALTIASRANPLYNGMRLGNGFVASHVWRSVDTGVRGARTGWTNSFLPNLVWLPAQVAKLTDRQGSFAQAFLQALSWKMYRHVAVSPALRPFVTDAWRHLPAPRGIPQQGLPEEDQLNFFMETADFIERRVDVIRRVRDGLATLNQRDLSLVRPSRYSDGLGRKRRRNVELLRRRLSRYLSAVALVSRDSATVPTSPPSETRTSRLE